ncbi:hypothetical protein K438DRAFT_1936649 [Mycena galopus ATCC 62051]|nr:hypothetical protein K438DRAFT_1936649 [Mycena galopus ATCC 62051]
MSLKPGFAGGGRELEKTVCPPTFKIKHSSKMTQMATCNNFKTPSLLYPQDYHRCNSSWVRPNFASRAHLPCLTSGPHASSPVVATPRRLQLICQGNTYARQLQVLTFGDCFLSLKFNANGQFIPSQPTQATQISSSADHCSTISKLQSLSSSSRSHSLSTARDSSPAFFRI